MAKRRINVSLSHGGIENLIAQLEAYKLELDRKCTEFVRRLMALGIQTAKVHVGAGDGDSPTDVSFDVVYSYGQYFTRGTLYMKSKPVVDNKGREFYPHLAWEFGAGIYYNNGAGNPLNANYGLGPGTFPDQRYAINPGYWYYKDDSGNTHLSLGTQATMPMYNALITAMERASSIAKEVFG